MPANTLMVFISIAILPQVWQTFNVPLSWYMSINPWFKGAHAHEKLYVLLFCQKCDAYYKKRFNKINYVLYYLDS